ncbi:MAG: DUF123 domain-containing protein [Haloarculaceae archaeon]
MTDGDGDNGSDSGVGPDGDADTDPDADEGTYTLVVELADPARIAVGALGEYAFDAGWYAYTGSAFGPGGFARVDRHRELAAGERDARHWHVDYLLGHPAASVDAVVRTPGADVECAVARAVAGERVPGFGASDCDCDSHLAYAEERATLVSSVERAHGESA